MSNLLRPPTFPDEEQTHTAKALHAILLSLMSAVPLIFAAIVIVPDFAIRGVVIISAVYILCVPLFILNRRGDTTAASIGLIAGLWGIVTLVVLTAGGVHAPGTTAYLFVIFIAGLLLGGRAGIFVGVVCTLSTLVLALLELAGKLPPSAIPAHPLFFWIAATFFMTIMVSLQNLASVTIKEALRQSRKEIEERRHAEKEARESEARYRSLIENTPDIIASFDYEGRYLFVNSAISSVSNLRPDEFVGKRMHEVGFRKEQASFRERVIRTVFGTRTPFEGEFEFDGVHGKSYHEWRVYPVVDSGGNVQSAFSVNRNITERKKAEEAARREQELTLRIMEASPVGIAFINRDGHITFANRRSEEILGLSRTDITQLTYDAVDWKITDSAGKPFPDDQLPARQVMTTRKNVRNVEHAIEWPNGKRILLSVNASPILDKNGQLDGVVTVFDDVTEQRRVGVELRETLSQLRDLSKRLREVREEEQTRISREIHDDLGQALTALKIDMAWVRKHLPPQEAALAHRLETMMRLVDSTIQSVQKISSELRLGILDDLGLAAALEWLAADFTTRTGIRCEAIELEELPGLPTPAATAGFRICQEALTNIIRHAHASLVKMHLKKEDEMFILSIQDDGRGISQEEASSRRAIGLLGMKERARALGGSVEIVRRPEKGTSVIARIPLKPTMKESIE